MPSAERRRAAYYRAQRAKERADGPVDRNMDRAMNAKHFGQPWRKPAKLKSDRLKRR